VRAESLSQEEAVAKILAYFYTKICKIDLPDSQGFNLLNFRKSMLLERKSSGLPFKYQLISDKFRLICHPNPFYFPLPNEIPIRLLFIFAFRGL
jgi:hypothetical protein